MERNKIPVLDDGYVVLLSGIDNSTLKYILQKYSKNDQPYLLYKMIIFHLEIRCPIFVQLALCGVGVQCRPMHNIRITAYIPTIEEINGPDHETNQQIQRDIEQTTEALVINTRAYTEDGCDTFVAQTVAPISTYNNLFISMSLADIIELCRVNLPRPIAAYVTAIRDALHAHCNYLHGVLYGKKKETNR